MSTHPIRFHHRGRLVEVDESSPTRTVLDWLREDAHCSGTKEGCNEGDCGACTVVIGELPETTDTPGESVRGLRLRTVNACIQFLPTLHGKALFTVEDLKSSPDGALHPVQQAMVECHGSQCGFCTPGFVMSLWASCEQHVAQGTRPSRQQLADDLAGNLCRCTGYRPIIDAGQRMFELNPVPLDTAPVIESLQSIGRVEAFNRPGYHAPHDLASLAGLRKAHPQARLVAGSTDVGLWVTKQFKSLGEVIYLGNVQEIKAIESRDGELRIGAGASLEAAWQALAARCPELTEVWLRFASPPIRHAGTMGGNVANGSPIGDAPPVLMALDASIELRLGERVRRMPLSEFYVDYMKNRLDLGEFVQALAVPLRAFERQVRAYKISKRFDSDISALCAGLAIELDADIVKEARFAFGGMAAVVKRASHTEAAVIGKPWTQATVLAAREAMGRDFAPLSDMRASAAYRMQVAQNLLQRFWLETRRTNPLRLQSTSVWSVMPHATAQAGA